MLELYGLKIKTSLSVYEPAEDTFLLISVIEKLDLNGKTALEIGTGSGIISLFLAKTAKHVTAIDINPEAICCAKENAARNKIKNVEFRKSDLFENVKEILRNKESSKASNVGERKFDIIVFNPPYLPDEPLTSDIALDGGPDGRKTIERFLKDAPKFLNTHGRILLLESSLSNYEKTLHHFKKIGFNAKIVKRRNFDWEELIVIEATHI